MADGLAAAVEDALKCAAAIGTVVFGTPSAPVQQWRLAGLCVRGYVPVPGAGFATGACGNGDIGSSPVQFCLPEHETLVSSYRA